ncbi:MFS transporter [Desulfopila inferna]|uniref:MFS transporter n=1 Tax=Desulfopila inferna TaxID=468528 RepID=UPI0019652BF3|nr:MFS transporter [Desulfopila inferna]MBM9603610.1 MFS transporter [Desulfopila inferna]
MSLRGCGVFTAAFFTVSIAYAVRYGYGMLLPGMLATLEITKTQAGVIYSSYFVAYTVFSPILGTLSDRFDSRILLTCFSALLAVGALLMAFVTTVPEAAIVFALAGIGHAACWAPVVSLVQQWADDRHRGTTLAVVTMGSGVGIAAWSLLLPIIVERSSWQAGWIQLGIFGFFVAGLNLLFIRNPEENEGGLSPISRVDVTRTLPRLSCRQFLGSLHLWLIGGSYLLVGFTVLVPFTFLSVYASEELHLSYATATRFFTIIAVAGMAGKLSLGILSDRWGRIPVMMMSCCLLGLGCWGIANVSDLRLKIFFIILIGIGFGAVWPVYAAAAMDFFPKAAAGSVIGVWTFFLGLGSITSPIVCGWSIDFSGSYTWAFNIGFAAAMLAAALLLPLLNQSERTLGKYKWDV